MGWFSPVKGSYPSLAQVDKTLPVSGDAKTLVRGMIVTLSKDADGKPVWDLAGGDSATFYVALQDYSDPTAGFAGTAFVPNPTAENPARPAVTAIDLAQDGEYETSVFDQEAMYDIGDELTVKDGFLTKGGGSGEKAVGIVTAVPASRWINNAIAVPDSGNIDARLAVRTGAREKVIRFKTAL